jgi:hypothetical protein
MQSEIDKVRRPYYKIAVEYAEGFKWRDGRINLGLRVLMLSYEG